jgi:hypothetical protein
VTQPGSGFGLGRMDVQVLDGLGLVQREGDLPVPQGGLAVVIDDDDVFQLRELVQDLADLGGVLALGDDGLGPGVLQADEKRLVAERGEERLADGPDLQDTDDADIELGDAVHEQADPIARLDAESAEERADGVGGSANVIVRERPFDPAQPFPAEGDLVGPAHLADPIGAVPADVQTAAGGEFELLFDLGPVEIPIFFLIRADVRHQGDPFLLKIPKGRA